MILCDLGAYEVGPNGVRAWCETHGRYHKTRELGYCRLETADAEKVRRGWDGQPRQMKASTSMSGETALRPTGGIKPCNCGQK